MSDDLITIEIDGRSVQARKGAMLIEVADQAGISIPRFCYHPKLSVAANCRMCLVEVEKVAKPLPACATPVNDGMKVWTRSKAAREAQNSVMEFLLINHPLDCPICDQGGECELQDVAMGFGADVSRFQERKRVVRDKDLGPLVATDMTRCIHCTRCVRFGEEIAGVRELGATGRGEFVEIGTFVEKHMNFEMSGNVIDLCPVGALTSKPFRFSARSWEMVQRPSVAPHDCVGSNLHVHLHRGRIKRVVPRDSEAINETWISDRDRFSYEGLDSEDRLLKPMVKQDGKWREVDWEEALSVAANGLKQVVSSHGPAAVGALVAPGATLEESYLLQRLMRGMGSHNVDHRLRQSDFSDQDQAPVFPWLGMPIAELEDQDTILVIGGHTRKQQPILNHRLRKAALKGARVMFLNPLDYEFNFPVAANLVIAPGAMPGALAGIIGALQGKQAPGGLVRGVKPAAEHRVVAEALKTGDKVAVLLGEMALEHPALSALRALAGHLALACDGALGYLPAANSAGAWVAGALPHREAGGEAVEEPGLHTGSMLEAGLKGYVLLGVEPDRDFGDPAAVRRALKDASTVVALTGYRTPELERLANVLLPMGLFGETSGTHVNLAGDWQSFAGLTAPPGEARPAWKILRVLGNTYGVAGFEYVSSEEVRDEVRKALGSREPDNRRAWGEPGGGTAGGGLERVSEVLPYAIDPLVRRAAALQATADAADGGLHLNAGEAERLGLVEGRHARVRQSEAQASLEVVLDERVPDGCVLVYGGTPVSAELGAGYGPVTVDPV